MADKPVSYVLPIKRVVVADDDIRRDDASPVRAAALAAVRFRGAGVALLMAASLGVAEVGRRRQGGRRVFSTDAALWAPLWLGERAVGAWLACATRLLFGGVRYNGVVVRRAAHSARPLSSRLSPPPRRPTVPVGSAR